MRLLHGFTLLWNSVKRSLLLVVFALLPACALFQRPPRPIHASPQEAQGITFPMELLATEGNVSLSGTTLAAIQLAMEDFLPWDIQPHKEATLREVCLYKRESYDVVAAPGSEGIDVRTWRILAVQR